MTETPAEEAQHLTAYTRKRCIHSISSKLQWLFSSPKEFFQARFLQVGSEEVPTVQILNLFPEHLEICQSGSRIPFWSKVQLWTVITVSALVLMNSAKNVTTQQLYVKRSKGKMFAANRHSNADAVSYKQVHAIKEGGRSRWYFVITTARMLGKMPFLAVRMYERPIRDKYISTYLGTIRPIFNLPFWPIFAPVAHFKVKCLFLTFLRRYCTFIYFNAIKINST